VIATRDAGDPAWPRAREAEIAALIVAGKSTKEIAGILGIGTQTVYSHVTAILRRMHLRSRRELHQALAAGWVF
jgi:DNA-binding CsgD family transcriptional regulator